MSVCVSLCSGGEQGGGIGLHQDQRAQVQLHARLLLSKSNHDYVQKIVQALQSWLLLQHKIPRQTMPDFH